MIYAVGDIHGELWKLRSVLEQIEERFEESDRLVFLGDYVDRGPDTNGVLELLLRLRERRPETVFLRGNHEQEMLESQAAWASENQMADFDQAANWFAQGGAETVASYPKLSSGSWYDRIPDEHWEFLDGLAMEFREGPYLFVHAGIAPPGYRWTDGDSRLWIREPFLSSTADLGAIVVFGHTPQRRGLPLVMSNKIGIDTAAAFGGPLTAVILDPSKPYAPEELVFVRSA